MLSEINHEEITCEIEFQDPQETKLLKIVGNINLSQIFDKKIPFIIVENRIKVDTSWKIVHSLINKKDVEKITFFAPECFICVNKYDLGSYLSIPSQAAQDS
ncbi:MAG: hypothetical protein BAJALOKI1v1_390008 [Promethearchaeota archaeon]|nr:MAG: hypothetical protein BAJALOKI1v1_390008 [Candidatus Lokiarchaeota archaeon]